MTRGRRPLIALREAADIAARRGKVLLMPARRNAYFDLIICTEQQTAFVRVKRIVTHYDDPQEIMQCCKREISPIRTVPVTGIVARELWLRSPRGVWQFFLIQPDTINGILPDGSRMPGTD
ncbi:MAG: hypothetical protein WC391_08155 [Methanoregula sp.]|jgi:2-polyprenyl-3-methyl-5-hydroxy-6-metoxy-1,4-benzoquinol methylase